MKSNGGEWGMDINFSEEQLQNVFAWPPSNIFSYSVNVPLTNLERTKLYQFGPLRTKQGQGGPKRVKVDKDGQRTIVDIARLTKAHHIGPRLTKWSKWAIERTKTPLTTLDQSASRGGDVEGGVQLVIHKCELDIETI